MSLVEATFPTAPDALTEEATSEGVTPYGEWDAFTGTFMLDRGIRAVGLQSVKTQAYAGSSASVRLTHWFYKNGQILYPDLSPYSHIHFWIRTATNLDPNAWTLDIIDASGNNATINLIVTPDQWVENFWALENLSVPAGFNWTRIMGIRIYNDTKPVNEDSAFWLDDLYFWGQLAEGALLVKSNPTGKTGNMTYLGETFPFTAPSQTPNLPVGTTVTVTIDPTDFVNWDDGNTNPTRTETIEVGTKTITAIYSVAEPAKLTTLSLDEKGNSFPGQNAVKLVYEGIEQYLDVPFSYRLTKGTYTLVAVPPEDRTFSFWRKPDGSTTEEQYITIDLQQDTQVEVHWIKKGMKIPILAVVGLIFIPLAYILLKGD